MSVCLSVCLSVHARSRERNIVSPRFFRWRKEILLESCTNCLLSLYDAWFDRLCVGATCTHVTLSGYSGQDESCPPLERCWSILEGHAHHSWYSRTWTSYRGRRTCVLERVTEESLEGYTLKHTRVTEKLSKVTRWRLARERVIEEGHARERVTGESWSVPHEILGTEHRIAALLSPA